MPQFTYCQCIRITRKDGEIISLTSFDSDILIGTRTYYANSAADPFAVSKEVNNANSNGEIKGIAQSDLISARDIALGKYDSARVIVALIDYTNVPNLITDGIVILSGFVGNIKQNNRRYTFEIKSKIDALKTALSYKASHLCPHQFGDNKCGKDLTSLIATHTATYVTNLRIDLNFTYVDNQLNNGIVEFLSGSLQGFKFDIESNNGHQVRLYDTLPDVFSGSVSVRVTRGCTKTFEACRSYNNGERFGGFPSEGNWMRGIDFLASGESDED